MILYGFKSCDMVRAEMKWLDARNAIYTFVDYRRVPLDPATIDDWFDRAGWEAVFNRKSTAFRALPERQQSTITRATAKPLILAETNFIKRPLLDTGECLLTGFNAARWEAANLG